MVFSSITFLFYFLPIVLLSYYLVPKKVKNIVLLISSLFFYFWGEPKNILIMILMIFVSYIGGLVIDKLREKKSKFIKLFLFIIIVIDLSALFYFKYIDFLIRNINLYLENKIDLIGEILPIGISFFTFQIISYLIDVYRGDTKVQKNIFKLALYVSLFPQLIAGPIVRYKDVAEQIDERTHTVEKFSNGIRRFVIGLSKKVLIANILGELAGAFGTSSDGTIVFYWLYAIANMLQIYFDFSGYSDMAIGLGKMFGFEFLENFNYPYIATSITDFWRRWHMSLSSWFKDYVYIPLGGNRKGLKRQIINIFIVWFLTGLWHGANWNFILWGVYFGTILLIEKVFLLKVLDKTPKVINRIYVLFTVLISFILFSNEDLNIAFQNIKGLFVSDVGFVSNVSLYYLTSYLVVILIGIIGSTPLLKNLINKLSSKNEKVKKVINVLEPVVLTMFLIISVSYIIDGSFNPFLYFRF